MKSNKKQVEKVITIPKIVFPKFKFFWKKDKNDKALRRPVTSAQVLINGKLIVFVFCSLVSAFINLVFISNLTKSDYNIGTLISVPAAVLLGLLSIGLDIGKFLLAIQVNTLGELIRKLSKFSWVKKVKKAAVWWRTVYVTFIMLSVITSVSLSTISIGAGISRNANLIKQIDEYVVQGEQYTNINAAAGDVTRQSLINKATDTSEKDAIAFVETQVSSTWSKIQEWQEEYDAFVAADLDPNDKTLIEGGYKGSKNYYDYWTKRDNEINVALQSSKYSKSRLTERQIRNITLATFESEIKKNYLATYQTKNSDVAVDRLNELTDNTNQEILAWLETLNALGLVNPKTGEVLQFSVDENKAATVLAKSALTLLKALRVDVENDSGDIGSSSKLFMQLGGAWDARHIGDKDLQAALNVKTDGSFGSTEVMMMGMLLFLSLLCELLINLFSPKTNISRKMLSQFSEYFDSDFDVNDFMLDLYIDQLNFGVLDRASFDMKSKKAVELTELTKESLYEKYKRKPKAVSKPVNTDTVKPKVERIIVEDNVEQPAGYSDKVARKIKEVEEI